VVSKKGISVERTARLNDVLLFSQKIEIEANLQGNFQLFATDTIRIQDGVSMLFPSTIALIGGQCEKPLIQIGKNCTLLGDIVLQATSSTPKAVCIIGVQTNIHGKVYCAGKVELRGKVNGSVYCDGFTLSTPTSLYENHLLNATIDHSSLSAYYSGSVFFSDSPHYKEIKWEY
jgi:hypothetical protein